jgi:hypothetical protein
MEYISVKTKPNISYKPHTDKLILLTEKYGVFLGFYDGEYYRTNYATILENVTHYCKLPNFPTK